MIRLNLTKRIASLLLGVSILTLVPIGASADTWSQDKWGKWHLYDDNGKPKGGWVQDGSNWYYTDSLTGAMQTNSYIDGYYLGADGACTDGPAEEITKYGKVITSESVKATLDMYNKLLNEGWVKRNSAYHWYDNWVSLRLPDRNDGARYATECYINSGIVTVKWVTISQNYSEYKEAKCSNYADLTLDQYLKYKSEGKIGTFAYYETTLGGGASSSSTIIQEYIKNDATNTASSELLTSEEQKEKLKEQLEDANKKNEENRKKLEAMGYYFMN